MKTTWRVTIILLALVWLGAAGCGKDSSGQTETKKADAPLSIEVATVERRDVDQRIEITGTLAAWEEATLAAEVDGRVVDIQRDLGDHVGRGGVLAKFAAEEYALKAAQADAELAAARADYDRVAKLADGRLISQQQVDEARRRLDVARATADLAHKKLNDTSLRAPFDGAVAERLINQGDYVKAGTAAFRIVRVSPLKFRGDVPERFAGDVKVGNLVAAYLAGVEGEPLRGRIVRIAPAVSATSRSFTVEAQIENPGGRVKPGTFARLSIETRVTRSMLTVPDRAVIEFAGNQHVFVIANGRASDRQVVLLGKNGDRVLIGEGLQEGESVAVTAVEMLVDGRAVAVRAGAAQ